MREDAFCALHGALSFGFYAAVLLITMLVMHPAFLLVSLLSAAAYLAALCGGRYLLRQLRWVLPLMALTALLNPLFNHRGMTVLFYLRNGNAVTWEALAYGLAAAAMLGAVLLWFASCNRVLTSDKLMALFGRALPAFSLLFSMALRFVPRFSRQVRQVAAAQRALGGEPPWGLSGRVRSGVRALSVTVTWALENAVVTADSMKSRGYGLPGRTAFARQRFDGRDRRFAALLLALALGALAGLLTGQAAMTYYPVLAPAPWNAPGALTLACFALFCNLPLLLNRKEALTWRRLRSNI